MLALPVTRTWALISYILAHSILPQLFRSEVTFVLRLSKRVTLWGRGRVFSSEECVLFLVVPLKSVYLDPTTPTEVLLFVDRCLISCLKGGYKKETSYTAMVLKSLLSWFI